MADRIKYSTIVRAPNADALAAALNAPRHSEDDDATLGLGLRTVRVDGMLGASDDGAPSATDRQFSLVVDDDMAPRFEQICDDHGAHYIRTDQWTGPAREHVPEHVEVGGEMVRASLRNHRRSQSKKRVTTE